MTLTVLGLSMNCVGTGGTLAMARSLETNSSTAEQDLTGNLYVGDEGVMALAKALESNSTLTKLRLRYNSIGGEDVVAMAKALESNSSLMELVSTATNSEMKVPWPLEKRWSPIRH